MQQIQQQMMQAFQLLQQGQAERAAELSTSACLAAPQSPDAHHLMALCDKEQGKPTEAEAGFQKAIALGPDNPQILTNYANFLMNQDRPVDAIEHYKAAGRIDNNFLNAFMGLGTSALALGDFQTAIVAYNHVTEKQPQYSAAWQGLGVALRDVERLNDAAIAFEKAVELDPTNSAALVNLGVVQRMLGDLEKALISFDRAEEEGFTGPELLDGRASVLLDLGKTDESKAGFRQLTHAFPAYIPGHDALARILWEHEPDGDPLAEMKLNVEQQPENMPLHTSYILLLCTQKRWDEVLREVNAARKKADTPSLIVSEAFAQEGLGNLDQAETLFTKSVEHFPKNAEVRTAFARHLLRTGRVDAAAHQLEAGIEHNPDDQMAWAYLGTCWRLMDDPREDWLHRYDEFISPLEVEPPKPYGTREEFCAELEQALMPMHRAEQEPIDQSLRKGTQTSGHLFGHPEGLVRQARDAIADAIAKYQSQLPVDDKHPFLRRSSPAFRFQGAWSVRLFSSGFHINHVHGKGWLSSAFYVALPPSVGVDDDDQRGYIQFGQPPLDLGLELEPRRYIKPRVGCIAVFPSYTWHGTVPFEDEAPRMTMAYDVVPQR